ncbi:MAG: TonB-dependent receptor [Colwellia sp.]
MTIKCKKNRIYLAVCGAFLSIVSNSTFSQEQQTQADEKEIEVIEIRGMRGSIAGSQEIKRLADTVKDVITSKDIGALPDKSVTEALQRIPGVTIERFESATDSNHFSSEGSGVVVRGLKRIRSEINGRDAFSSSSYGGGLSYADIPGELLGRIEVVKNTTADLISGGVAGTVNLVTRKPFDSEDMTIYGQIKGSYGDHREEWTPAATFMFSNVWESDHGKFGFLIGGTSSEHKDRGDGVGVESFYERSLTAAETEYFGDQGTAIPGHEDETLYSPPGIAIRRADSDRTRDGIVSSLQWTNPSETIEITAEYILSDASIAWDERAVQYGEQGYKVNPNVIGVVSGEFGDDGFMTAGEVNTDWLYIQSRWNKVATKVEDMSLHAKYTPTENLELNFDYQHIDSTNSVRDWTYSSIINPTMGSWYSNDGITRPDTVINDTGVEFDLTGDVPSGVNYTGDVLNPTYPEQGYLRSKMDHEEDNEADADTLAFDLQYHLEGSWITSVKAGAYASKKTQLSRNSAWNWAEVNSAWTANPYESTYLKHPELFEQFTYDANDFFGGGVLKGDQSFWFPKTEDVHNFGDFGDMPAEQGISAGAPNLDQREGATGSYLDSEITETTEDRFEVYLQANYEFDDLDMPIKGNFGLRYISWQVESNGGLLFPTQFGWDAQGTSAIIAAEYPDEYAFAYPTEGERVTVKGDKYTRVLPSFNLSMEVTEEHILRFAVSENVYFPVFANFQNYKNITASRVYDFYAEPGEPSVTSVDFSGMTGNPDIKPEEAINFDLSFEWYFSDTGSLTTSVFVKELDNVIHKRLYTENVTNPEPNPAVADNYPNGVTQPVAFQTDTNEGGGTISGIEFSYVQFYDFLPGIWSGFGLSANYTYIDQSGLEDEVGFGEGSAGEGGRNSYRAFNNLDLEGYSENTFNTALMYEKYDISARLAYSWRSEYLLTRRDADQFAPVVALDTGQLDASISYQINEQFKIGLEASNLLDEVIKTEIIYNQEGMQTPRSHFKTDRRYGVYLSASF